jgi:hypothetical protein
VMPDARPPTVRLTRQAGRFTDRRSSARQPSIRRSMVVRSPTATQAGCGIVRRVVADLSESGVEHAVDADPGHEHPWNMRRIEHHRRRLRAAEPADWDALSWSMQLIAVLGSFTAGEIARRAISTIWMTPNSTSC